MLSHFYLYGEQRSSGVMGRRNGPSGLRDDDDDDIHLEKLTKCNFFRKTCEHQSIGLVFLKCHKVMTLRF